MAGFKFLLDGVQVEEPDGFQDFEEEIVRDEEKRIIRFDYPLNLTFVGDGYDYIEAKYQEAYNSEIIFTIIDSRQNVDQIFVKAVIKISNCTFNISALPKKTVDCEIDDNIYQSLIFNNEKRPVSLGGNQTLNGFALDPITPIDLKVFTVATGVNRPDDRQAYDFKDSFAHVISFLTDGQVNFESDWYDNLPDEEKIAILTGAELRSPTEAFEAPVIKLTELFENIWKKFNLYLIVENPISNPTIRLEQESYLHGNTTALVLNDVEGLKRLTDYEKLYNRLEIGSQTYIRELGTNFALFYIPFLAFVEEEYNITGVVNVDRALDLVSSYIIDHNVIADAIENNDTQYDEDIVFIQYTASTSTATKGTYFPSPNEDARFYNEIFLNSNVAQRFNFLGDIVLNSGLLEASFQAEQTTNIEASGPIGLIFPSPVTTEVYNNSTFPFEDDSTPPNFDTGNNYNNTTYLYTAPATGFYRFEFNLGIYITTFAPSTQAQLRYQQRMAFVKNGIDTIIPEQVYVQNYNGVNIIPGFEDYIDQNNNPGITLQGLQTGHGRWLTVAQTIFLQTGETISSELIARASIYNTPDDAAFFRITYLNSIFSNPATPISGGTYQSNDPDLYYVGIYKIDELGLSDQEWNGLKDNLTGTILIDTGNNDVRKSYISRIKRQLISGNTEVETIFNRNQPIK